MRRLILLLATIGVAVLLASGAALGITNGTPDGTRHPYVGALVDKFDGETYPYCTGTLISPTVLLTAAHCYPETEDHFYVTFEEKPTSDMAKDNGLRGTWHAHPTIDIAVVKFAQPVSGRTPARLPSLNRLAQSDVGKGKKYAKFTAVGYGEQATSPNDTTDYKAERRYAPSAYKSINRTYLSLSQNIHQGNGGTCYGDSGGPNFFGAGSTETNVIAGLTVTGDTWCKATNVTLRLDTEPVHAFLKDQGVTPPSTVTP